PVDDGRPYHSGSLWRQLYCCAVGDPHSLATGENRQNARQGGDLCYFPKKRARDQGWRVANKKACWYEFDATLGEHGYPPGAPRRNAAVLRIVRERHALFPNLASLAPPSR